MFCIVTVLCVNILYGDSVVPKRSVLW